MANADLALDLPAPEAVLADLVQANLGRVSKFADGKTKNWTAYYFFRILSQAEVGETVRQFNALRDTTKLAEALLAFRGSLEVPPVIGAGQSTPPSGPDPSPLFRDWLKVVA